MPVTGSPGPVIAPVAPMAPVPPPGVVLASPVNSGPLPVVNCAGPAGLQQGFPNAEGSPAPSRTRRHANKDKKGGNGRNKPPQGQPPQGQPPGPPPTGTNSTES